MKTIFLDFTASKENRTIVIENGNFHFELEVGTPSSVTTEIQSMGDSKKETHVPFNIRSLGTFPCKITINASLYCKDILTRSLSFPRYSAKSIVPNQILSSKMEADGDLYGCEHYRVTGQLEVTFEDQDTST